MSDPKALASAVINARMEARISTAKELAQKLDMSVRLVNEIENARRESYSKSTLAKLDVTFGWPSGTAERILSTGQSSIPLDTPAESEKEPTIEPWRVIESGETAYLQVSAEYDPSRIGEEDLQRVALNARYQMRKELAEVVAIPEPVPLYSYQKYENSLIAADDRAHNAPKGLGDEDEQRETEP